MNTKDRVAANMRIFLARLGVEGWASMVARAQRLYGKNVEVMSNGTFHRWLTGESAQAWRLLDTLAANLEVEPWELLAPPKELRTAGLSEAALQLAREFDASNPHEQANLLVRLQAEIHAPRRRALVSPPAPESALTASAPRAPSKRRQRG